MGAQNLKVRVINEITQESERDKQRRVGPSGIGDPCPRCLGRALAGESDESSFSIYPWLGTAAHLWLEHNTFAEAKHELKLFVGTVDGYGDIKGTTDLYLEGTVGDWKLVGLKKIKEYRLKGAPAKYRYQAQLYARGCELAGLSVDSIAIIFIPRDSMDVNDIYIHEEAYQPEMAEAALKRAGTIYALVQESGWESLPSDDDCWTCRMKY
jgi:hypothetical protein